MAKLPAFIEPMLAKIGKPFASDEHVFEIKWDGTRALAFVEDGSYRLLNRKRRSRKDAYPELEFLAGLPGGTVLDGEIVILEKGRPTFAAMLQREQAQEPRRVQALMKQLPAAYVAFDLLMRDGKSMMRRPLSERREALHELLAPHPDPRLIRSDGVVGDGATFFEEAVKRELEGVVAKRLTSPYLPGKRTDAWVKIKRTQRMYCAVLGFIAEGGDLRSLVIAAEDGGTLHYAGRVGSGWNDAKRAEVHTVLRRHLRAEPFLPAPVEATWVEPGLYCTVEFLERTEAGELRAPVFVELIEE
ncbi:MAG: non-homologous end-joining DNA ligase [Candidatus Eiseniibacteriota bacterium]